MNKKIYKGSKREKEMLMYVIMRAMQCQRDFKRYSSFHSRLRNIKTYEVKDGRMTILITFILKV